MLLGDAHLFKLLDPPGVELLVAKLVRTLRPGSLLDQIGLQAGLEVPQIRGAVRSLHPRPDLVEKTDHQRHQDGNDQHHRQQFDQGKPGRTAATISCDRQTPDQGTTGIGVGCGFPGTIGGMDENALKGAKLVSDVRDPRISKGVVARRVVP